MGFYKNTNGVLTPIAGGVSYSYAPIGAIYPYGGSSAPSGYLMCDGAAVSRTDYSALFAVIGTSFGAGDGSTTFNIPDLRGEFLRGAGTNSHTGQGNGGSVGEHQDATENPNVMAHLNNDWVGGYVTGGSMTSNPVKKPDKNIKSGNAYTVYANSSSFSSPEAIEYYTSRPTNTSVNFIIKAKDVNLSVGGQALADRVETLETLASDVIPSTASASNQLVTANEADLLTTPASKFQIGSGGAIGYADLGATTSTISQAFSWLEVEYGRVDGFIDKYFISVAGASRNLNHIRVVRLTNYEQTPTITLDTNKHIWMSMDTYVYIRVKAYGNFSISGTLSRTAPTGTTVPINRLVTGNEINPTLTATFTAESGIKSGGVTVQGCKKIGDGLAVVTGYINKNTVLTVNDAQSNIGGLGITRHASVGTNPTSLFLWSQGHSPQCVSTVWKVTGGCLAVPWEDGDYTLTEDAWFNAVVRYN